MKKKLRFFLFSEMDGVSWQLVALYKEIVKRGHHVDVFADSYYPRSIVPFVLENIVWQDIRRFDLNSIEDKYDVLISVPTYLKKSVLKESGISIGLSAGATGTWLSSSPNLEKVISHNLWIGQNNYETIERKKEGFTEDFPVIGIPSFDLYDRGKKNNFNDGDSLVGFYPESAPFSSANKKTFNCFLIDFAKKNKAVNVLIKKRFLSKEEFSHHKYSDIFDGGCSNLLIQDPYVSLIDLVQKSDFLLGVSCSVFLDAIYLKKPVFFINDLDEYIFDRPLSEHTYPYLPAMTSVVSNTLVGKFNSVYSNAVKVDSKLYANLFPHHDISAKILDVAEMILDVAKGVTIRDISFLMPYDNLSGIKKYTEHLINRFKKNPLKCIEHQRMLEIKYQVLTSVLGCVRYVFPHLDHDVYIEFVKNVNFIIGKVKKGTTSFDNKESFLRNYFIKPQDMFIDFLIEKGKLQKSYLPKAGALYEPKHKDVVLHAASELLQLGEYRYLESLCELTKESIVEMWYYLGRVYKETNSKKAVAIFNDILRKKKFNSCEHLKKSAAFHLAQIYEMLGDKKKDKLYKNLFCEAKGNHLEAGKKFFNIN